MWPVVIFFLLLVCAVGWFYCRVQAHRKTNLIRPQSTSAPLQPVPLGLLIDSPRPIRGDALAAYRDAQLSDYVSSEFELNTASQGWQTTWNKGVKDIDRLIEAGNWDSARAALQRVAYGMLNAPQADKERFTAAMCQFAKRDPLYSDVMAIVTPLVEQTPGITQTKIYPHLPAIDPETIRYVLYYAAELGDIVRQKKGNSYALHLSSHINISNSGLVGTRHAIMLERRDQMLRNVARRPLWQLRAVRDGRDPEGCPGLTYPVLPWDDSFWDTQGPWICRRPDCRCSVRAYGLEEIPMP
jgi:hypothetical protein